MSSFWSDGNLDLKYIFSFAFLLLNCHSGDQDQDTLNWAHYQGDPGSNQYSNSNQINQGNVSNLKQAWVYHSGDTDSLNRSQIQCNPLIIDGILYGTNPKLKLFALDATTGKEIWKFDPFEADYTMFGMGVNRGLAFWSNGQEKRLFFSAGNYIHAIDATHGTLLKEFGEGGKVDLHTGLGERAQSLFVTANTPGIIFGDLLIIGIRVSEAMGAAPGYIRAFDVHSGAIKWTFHSIPQPGEVGYNTWPQNAFKEMGGANAWSGMSVDHKLGIVYVPTGSAAYDFYGGDRHGDNLFANCLIALDAKTGERIWHYQMVRHDLWDRDLPAPPNLIDISVGGKRIEAVAQITKSGYVFIFDRLSGEPVFPIREVPGLASSLEGEKTALSQPTPSMPPRFSRGEFKEEDITNRTAQAHAFVRSIWQSLQKGQEFIPPSEEGTLLLPGFDGGGEWGGASVDPDGIMYVNASEMPWIIKMIPFKDEDDGLLASKGKNLYGVHCQLCHGADKKGAGIYTVPSLVDLQKRLKLEEVKKIIENGRGMMPSFKYLKPDDVEAIVSYLFELRVKMDPAQRSNMAKSSWKYPYFMSGYTRFLDHEGFPAITPPWGTLNAIDLNKGKLLWKTTLGHHPKLPPATPDNYSGTENYGGPVSTAGGLVFIGATMDAKIRAFASQDGSVLWEHDLPAPAYATPAIYSVKGKQFVVIACGGGKLGSPSGDAYVAFALAGK